MEEKKVRRTVQTYTALYEGAWKRKGITDSGSRKKQYEKKLTGMLESESFRKHNIYPTMDMFKIYAVIAMCLCLQEENYSREEIIAFVNDAFRKPRKMFHILEKLIDLLPNAYSIAEKWNRNDHENRVKDGSVYYESFQVEDGRIEYNITKCMYAEIFKEYGIRGFCKIFCKTDEEAYANLSRHVSFTRYADLSAGDSCHDVITRKK